RYVAVGRPGGGRRGPEAGACAPALPPCRDQRVGRDARRRGPRRLGDFVGAYYSAARLFASGCFGFLTRWDVRGRQHGARNGGLIVASNHISFWDPPMVGASLPREVHFLAKEELFRTPGLGLLIRSLNAIPIRRGVADLSGLSRALEVLKAGDALLMFPE